MRRNTRRCWSSAWPSWRCGASRCARSLLRYGERLAGHDAGLRVLGRVRERLYGQLERLGPAGLPRTRRGEVLHHLVSDVDSTVDVLVRSVLPYAAAVLAGLAAAVGLGVALPAAGVLLLGGLAVVAFGVPVLHRCVAGRAERRLAPGGGRR